MYFCLTLRYFAYRLHLHINSWTFNHYEGWTFICCSCWCFSACWREIESISWTEGETDRETRIITQWTDIMSEGAFFCFSFFTRYILNIFTIFKVFIFQEYKYSFRINFNPLRISCIVRHDVKPWTSLYIEVTAVNFFSCFGFLQQSQNRVKFWIC